MVDHIPHFHVFGRSHDHISNLVLGLLGTVCTFTNASALPPYASVRSLRQYENHPSSEVDPKKYLAGYSILLLLALSFMVTGFIIYLFGQLRAIKRTHEVLVKSVLTAPLRWLDSTPSGRIIARFTQDMNAVDGQ